MTVSNNAVRGTIQPSPLPPVTQSASLPSTLRLDSVAEDFAEQIFPEMKSRPVAISGAV